MNIYSTSDRETLHACELLKGWLEDGSISAAQYERLKRETVSDLSTTHLFLRLVLFLFSILGVIAAVALSNILFSRNSQTAMGILFLCFAVACYTAAEKLVAGLHFYRHGVEEALTLCSIALFYRGLSVVFFSKHAYPPHGIQSLVPAFASLLSLWIWRRFDLWYALPTAMLLAGFVPDAWTTSHAVRVVATAMLYAAGLVLIALIRSRRRSEEVDDPYPLAEAFLWLGLYLKLNLHISLLALPLLYGGYPRRFVAASPGPFYWMTWVLIWCLPILILTRGIRLKDRFVMAAGAIAALLTFITNKPYLGWQRHTWDPMLLGVLLTGIAWYLRRWLEDGPDGVRHGFTAASPSRRDREALNTASSLLALRSPQSINPTPQPATPDVHFGGGGSGGAGASGDF